MQFHVVLNWHQELLERVGPLSVADLNTEENDGRRGPSSRNLMKDDQPSLESQLPAGSGPIARRHGEDVKRLSTLVLRTPGVGADGTVGGLRRGLRRVRIDLDLMLRTRRLRNGYPTVSSFEVRQGLIGRA